METQVSLVSIKGPITQNYYDKALFFNGEYLISANSDMKQFATIEILASNLAKANNVDVAEMQYGVMEAGWDWLEIQDELQNSGALVGGLRERIMDQTNAAQKNIFTHGLDILEELLNSSNLSASAEAKDCLDVFHEYEWLMKDGCDEDVYANLLDKGIAGEMSLKELDQFMDMVSKDGQHHIYFSIYEGCKVLNQYRESCQ